MTNFTFPEKLREVAWALDALSDLAAPLVAASQTGITRLRDGHGNDYELTMKPLGSEHATALADWLKGTEMQDDLRRWADEMEREWDCVAPDYLRCEPVVDERGLNTIAVAPESSHDAAWIPHPYPKRHRLCGWQWVLREE